MSKLDQIRALREARTKRSSSRGERAPKLPGDAKPVSTETASDKGKAKHGPAARRSSPPIGGSLAPAKGTTQRGDRAPPVKPREPKPKKPKATSERKHKVGRPRVEDRGKTLSDLKPWLAEKTSRASWYRRRKAKP